MRSLLPLISLTLLLAAPVGAHPSRVRLLVHGSQPLTNTLTLKTRFVPAPDIKAGFAPLVFMELDWKPLPALTITPTIGWAFKPDEVIVALSLAPRWRRLSGWADFEFRPQSLSGYWFVQAEIRLTDWLKVGAEEESWGNLGDLATLSHGGGPNTLLQFGKHLGLDLALHVRKINEEVGAEPFVRIHLFL